jgi:hypothetical protein
MRCQLLSRMFVAAVLVLGIRLEAAEVVAVPSPGGQPDRGQNGYSRRVAFGVRRASGPPLLPERRRRPPLQSASRRSRTGDSRSRRGWNLRYWIWPSPQTAEFMAVGTNAWKLKLPKEQWGFRYA